MKSLRFIKSPGLWLILFLAAIAVMAYLRSIHHICVGDELRYFYCFDLKPGENYFNFSNLKLVDDFKDVWDSQINHYLRVNGRSLVHTSEQIFSGIIGVKWFYPINVAILLLTMWLFISFTTPRNLRTRPASILITVFLFLYLFPAPARLWYSINLASNYLWPACAFLGVGLCFRRMCCGWQPGILASIAIALLSFFLGWSNEAFSFPYSGALAIYLIANFRHIKRRYWIVALPLWGGACMMLCSPGNWQRAGNEVEHISTLATVLFQLKLIWILLATAAIAAIVRPWKTWHFIKSNYVVITSLALALCMGVIAHTAPRAFTAVELFSAILLMRAIVPVPSFHGKLASILCVCAATAIIAHQTVVTIHHHAQYVAIKQTVKAYETSTTGIVPYNPPPVPPLIKPFVYTQVPASEGADYEWRLLGLSRNKSKKTFTPLTPRTLTALSSLSPDSGYTFIEGGVFSRMDSKPPSKVKVMLDNGTEATLTRRVFRHGPHKYAMLIPPEGRKIIAFTLHPSVK